MLRSQPSRPVRDAFDTTSFRAMTFFMSTRTGPTSTPYSAARAAMRAAYALATIVLVGMQPVLTQVPPKALRSMTATFMPAPARREVT